MIALTRRDAGAVRRASTDDVTALVRLDRSVFGQQAWSQAVWRQTVEAAHRDVPVVYDEHGLAAYAVAAAAGGTGDLERIAVRTDRRGHRLADALLSAAVAGWRHGGATTALLEVRADNEAALHVYARHGWQLIDRRRDYYTDSDRRCDALVLRLDLSAATEPAEVTR